MSGTKRIAFVCIRASPVQKRKTRENFSDRVSKVLRLIDSKLSSKLSAGKYKASQCKYTLQHLAHSGEYSSNSCLVLSIFQFCSQMLLFGSSLITPAKANPNSWLRLLLLRVSQYLELYPDTFSSWLIIYLSHYE